MEIAQAQKDVRETFLARILPAPLSLGAWFTATVPLVFAFLGRHVARRP